jgi:hypothetical protein
MHNNSHTETNKGRANASHRATDEPSRVSPSRPSGSVSLSQVGARAVPFNADARTYEAFSLGERTEAKGTLTATTLDHATAEATERWYWDRGDRLGIREIGHEDAPIWPFEKQSFERLHVYAVQRSAPLRWELSGDRFRSEPVYRYTLKLITVIDLGVFRGEGFRWSRNNETSRERGAGNSLPSDQ